MAIYEPSSVNEPGQIESVTFPEVECKDKGSHVAVCVEQRNGRKDCILSSDNASHLCGMGDMKAKAVYALCGKRNYIVFGKRYFAANSSGYYKI